VSGTLAWVDGASLAIKRRTKKTGGEALSLDHPSFPSWQPFDR